MKKEDFDKNYPVLRESFAIFARQTDVWFRNAVSFKRASEVLLKQIEVDDQIEVTFEQRFPPPLHGAVILLIGMAIENQIKAILIAICPELVTDDGLNERLTHHNLRELIRVANERRPNIISVKGKKNYWINFDWLLNGVNTAFQKTRTIVVNLLTWTLDMVV